ncbi:MAG: hypothetical protein JW884_04860 [Deltaproteobacteria bacterium]|nr:hypothetical protein [Deltaproteobacteria bacterium]
MTKGRSPDTIDAMSDHAGKMLTLLRSGLLNLPKNHIAQQSSLAKPQRKDTAATTSLRFRGVQEGVL